MRNNQNHLQNTKTKPLKKNIVENTTFARKNKTKQNHTTLLKENPSFEKTKNLLEEDNSIFLPKSTPIFDRKTLLYCVKKRKTFFKPKERNNHFIKKKLVFEKCLKTWFRKPLLLKKQNLLFCNEFFLLVKTFLEKPLKKKPCFGKKPLDKKNLVKKYGKMNKKKEKILAKKKKLKTKSLEKKRLKKNNRIREKNLFGKT